MGAMSVTIRRASASDYPRLLEIYTPYVEKTAVTFDYVAPTGEEFSAKLDHLAQRYPVLVAEDRLSRPVGFAYASQFKDKAAYDWAVETTIYLHEDERGRGVGRQLYGALERALSAQGVLNLNACIAIPATGSVDEHLTLDSVRFHEALGYRLVGEFRQCGYKFDRWYSMVWMEKFLGSHFDGAAHAPAPFVPFPQVEMSF